jgi:inorganic pyrophosphatase/exopolyphosphatase
VLLGAILSDTVILNSPTTTDRDRAAVQYLEDHLGLDAEEFGREMFESGSDAADASVDALLSRDSKEYETAEGPMCIAQVETAGQILSDRLGELREALQAQHDKNGHVLSALMVTDILEKHTQLLVAGDVGAAERAFGAHAQDGIIDLPGVMSRKKQVAPPLRGAFSAPAARTSDRARRRRASSCRPWPQPASRPGQRRSRAWRTSSSSRATPARANRRRWRCSRTPATSAWTTSRRR